MADHREDRSLLDTDTARIRATARILKEAGVALADIADHLEQMRANDAHPWPTPEHEHLRQQVARALDNAVANGYPVDAWRSEEVAADLAEHDADLEDVPVPFLVVLVKDWRRRKAANG